MSAAKIILFFLAIVLALPAQASPRAIIEKSGFFGAIALGAGYDWSSDHGTDLTVGGYRISDNTYYQVNLAHRYSPFYLMHSKNTWQPFQIGVFMIYSLDSDRYFLESPKKYPTSGYYDQTALRYGFEFGSTYVFTEKNFSIGYRLRVFDTGVIAAYNNTESGLKYSVASGFALNYFF